MNAARHAAEPSTTSRSPQAHPDSAASSQPGSARNADLLSALAGTDAGRERALAGRTRRIVLSSLGVMREEKEGRSRARGLALAVLVVVLLLIAPLLWEVTDSFIAGEHPGDPGSQLTLWAGIVCCTLLAAALVAGWLKNRD